MTASELDQIAEIHKQKFSDLLSCLNLKNITEFYKIMNNNGKNLIIVEKSEEKVIGYAFFTLKAEKFIIKYFRQNILLFILNPILIFASLKVTFLNLFLKSIAQPTGSCLCQIAVRSNYERKGIAKKLIEEGENWLKQNSVKTYWLKVDISNHDACKLYKSIDFRVIASNEKSAYMRKDI